MNWPEWFKENKYAFLILSVFIFAAVVYATESLWWDSAVYVGMGKYIYSLGQSGLWEPARPPMMPLLLGFFWKIGISPAIAGVILGVVFSAASILLLYLIIKELADKKAAIIFSLLFALNIYLIIYSKVVLADIPAMFLTLAAVWLLIMNRLALAGAVTAMAVLTKFTSLILLPVMLTGILLRKKEQLPGYKSLVLGFSGLIVPYLAINALVYKNPIYPLIAGQQLIGSVVGNYTCPSSPVFYLNQAIIQIPLLLISLAAVAVVVKKKDWRLAVVAASGIFLLIYHSLLLNCKDARYAFAFAPFFYILAAVVFGELMKQKAKGGLIKWAKLGLAAFVAAQLVFSAITAAQAVIKSRSTANLYKDEFGSFLGGKNITGKVWSTTPAVALYSDVKVDELAYYPVFDNKKIRELNEKLDSSVQYVLINTCDIQCVNYDADCPENSKKLLERLRLKFNIAYDETNNDCQKTVYEWKK
ncbi:glycosyltransferase family 39 protein [Candidatus Woesearchaeota archaeon]|nr:glycosyltransferase family 39 protein [Candidatus Woesearchaeota archaeon]